MSSNFVSIYEGFFSGHYKVTGLTPGLQYRFVTTASNAIGESEFSTEVSWYSAELPSKPAALSRGSQSTRTQIELDWPVHLDNDIRVTGYVLEADIDHSDVFQVIYDGSDHPEYTDFVFTSVTTGEYYDFRYKVLNLIGESVYSDIFTTYACEMPTQPSVPTWVTSTETEI